MGGATGGSSRNLWVSGLSSSTRATDLKQVFSKYGKVRHIAQCGGPVWVAAALLMWSIVIVLSTPLVSYLCFRDCNTYINPVCLILIITEVEQPTLNNKHTYISVWLLPVYVKGLNCMQNKYKTDGIRMSHTVFIWSFFVSAGYRRQSGDKCSYTWCQMLWLCDYGDKRWCFKMHSASAQDRTAWANDICWTGEQLCSSSFY